jgi:hypothetical protein
MGIDTSNMSSPTGAALGTEDVSLMKWWLPGVFKLSTTSLF